MLCRKRWAVVMLRLKLWPQTPTLLPSVFLNKCPNTLMTMLCWRYCFECCTFMTSCWCTVYFEIALSVYGIMVFGSRVTPWDVWVIWEPQLISLAVHGCCWLSVILTIMGINFGRTKLILRLFQWESYIIYSVIMVQNTLRWLISFSLLQP